MPSAKRRANQRLRHLAGAEAGDARLLLIALHNGAEASRDFIGGHFDLHLAGKFGVQRWAVLMAFVAVLVVMVVRVALVVGVGLLFGLRGSFESFC